MNSRVRFGIRLSVQGQAFKEHTSVSGVLCVETRVADQHYHQIMRVTHKEEKV